MHDIYQQDETEAVLLVHSNNAFSSINRKVMLHNISLICPLTNKIVNCYIKPVRIFIVGNHEINSREGKIQGDPTAMGAFTPAVTPLIHFLSKLIFICKDRSKEVAFSSCIWFYSCRKSKQDQGILEYTTAPQVFVWLLPQTIQIIFDCQRIPL